VPAAAATTTIPPLPPPALLIPCGPNGVAAQLEKELRKARAQLSRFSEINPDEYARLQDAESKREEFECQVADRERQLNEAILRRVRSVEKERDETRSQVQNLRKEPLLPVDGKGQPLTADGVALSDQGHHPQGCCTTALISQPEGSDGLVLVSGVLAQPIHRHGGASRQRQPGPLPCPAQAEAGLWGDRGRPPRQHPGQPAHSPWRLGAASP